MDTGRNKRRMATEGTWCINDTGIIGEQGIQFAMGEKEN
jgi:hypothetical protein